MAYDILDDDPEALTPLGKLLHCIQAVEPVSLNLRNPRTKETLSVSIARIAHIEHERDKGGVFIVATLTDGRSAEGYVHALPQKPEDEHVLGALTIIEK